MRPYDTKRWALKAATERYRRDKPMRKRRVKEPFKGVVIEWLQACEVPLTQFWEELALPHTVLYISNQNYHTLIAIGREQNYSHAQVNECLELVEEPVT